jgi:hypothetical protein
MPHGPNLALKTTVRVYTSPHQELPPALLRRGLDDASPLWIDVAVLNNLISHGADRAGNSRTGSNACITRSTDDIGKVSDNLRESEVGILLPKPELARARLSRTAVTKCSGG